MDQTSAHDQPPYPEQKLLPAAGQTYEPLDIVATQEQLDEFDHAAALASLANTGMCVMSFEHELIRDMGAMKRTIASLREGETTSSEAADQLEKLHTRMEHSRRFLSGPLSPKTSYGNGSRASGIEARRWNPGRLIAAAKEDLAFYVGKRGADLTWEVDEGLTLPPASYAEWLTMLQNAFVNAVGAIAKRNWENDTVWGEGEPGRIHVEVRRNDGAPPTFFIHDNGIGVDLEKARTYFRPFKRGDSRYDTASRFGGYGLGLSIIQLVAGRHGMKASFVEPHEGWATTMRIGPEFDRPKPKSLAGQVSYSDRELDELLKYGSPHSLQMFIEAALRSCASRSQEEFTWSMGELLYRFREIKHRNRYIDEIVKDQRERFDERHAQRATEAAQAGETT
jgi:hypothetical protein